MGNADDSPREYDRSWTARLGPHLRQRVGFTIDRGTVVRFVVQLEYQHGDDWWPVVRYDHDERGAAVAAHDVTEEGLHIDIFRDGDKHATEFVTSPLPANVALDFAEDHLSQNLERFVERYERWHRTPTE